MSAGRTIKRGLLLTLVATALHAKAVGTLSENLVNESAILGYKIQYRIYLPENFDSMAHLPVIYVTDGQWYIRNGHMPELLDRLISRGKIRPVVAVFVDNRDPDQPRTNRRNNQFFCNEKYVDFYRVELVPHIEKRYGTTPLRGERAILGMSFGGLNAACFGLMANDTFELIGILSPALEPVPGIFNAYEKSPMLGLRIFLSHGRKRDNERDAQKFRRILDKKGYPMKYKTVNEGHNWRNWKPLLDDVLLYFFRPDKAPG